jgi:hypothetical protein
MINRWIFLTRFLSTIALGCHADALTGVSSLSLRIRHQITPPDAAGLNPTLIPLTLPISSAYQVLA